MSRLAENNNELTEADTRVGFYCCLPCFNSVGGGDESECWRDCEYHECALYRRNIHVNEACNEEDELGW